MLQKLGADTLIIEGMPFRQNIKARGSRRKKEQEEIMKMLTRLRYLLAEGFEVSSLAGYETGDSAVNAKILFIEQSETGRRRLKSEMFKVSSKEMELCSDLFLSHISKTRNNS